MDRKPNLGEQKMIINTEEIKKLIKKDKNSAALARNTGASRQLIDKYKKGQSEIEGMTLKTAVQLQKYINQEEKKMRIVELEKEELNKLEGVLKEKWHTMDAWEVVKNDSIDNVGKYLEGTGYYLSGKDFTIKKENKYTVKNLMSTVYDEGNNSIDLEFDVNGEKEVITVEAPEGSFEDEFYFDDQINLDKALTNKK